MDSLRIDLAEKVSYPDHLLINSKHFTFTLRLKLIFFTLLTIPNLTTLNMQISSVGFSFKPIATLQLSNSHGDLPSLSQMFRSDNNFYRKFSEIIIFRNEHIQTKRGIN